jgi:hypothetical protein
MINLHCKYTKYLICTQEIFSLRKKKFVLIDLTRRKPKNDGIMIINSPGYSIRHLWRGARTSVEHFSVAHFSSHSLRWAARRIGGGSSPARPPPPVKFSARSFQSSDFQPPPFFPCSDFQPPPFFREVSNKARFETEANSKTKPQSRQKFNV